MNIKSTIANLFIAIKAFLPSFVEIAATKLGGPVAGTVAVDVVNAAESTTPANEAPSVAAIAENVGRNLLDQAEPLLVGAVEHIGTKWEGIADGVITKFVPTEFQSDAKAFVAAGVADAEKELETEIPAIVEGLLKKV